MKILTTITALLLALPLILKNRKPTVAGITAEGDWTNDDRRYAIDEFLN